ncbi:protein SENSITIVITY TO RED LIGHT REDUCED 1 [Malania oleifera]|uniref:protein SENSITIVITY TO RED LIGHT REDUCED 1 n=1 Tax=Malania oleifera TaxID=397392 RepID=UPI0025AE87F0|nr:protein SENSITIVITY TO RED LIGHT REDUCED 1 [Malania oleifera]XP_057976586.1 protein SENSITIVITY TO RED LIGHT REDUCED 1 [Malania oleifera]
MAASAKTLTLENTKLTGEWTVVLPRRGKHRKAIPKLKMPEQPEAWAPSDLESDHRRESKLMQKMLICLKKLESSQFYQSFLDQIQTPNILDSLLRILGSELKMQMVIYGIGSIESYESPRLQLSLAILMKRKFSWIGDVEVFDPIVSATESRILQSLGCSVLSVNEQGRRQALKPTMFFMPHCEAKLYDNLLQANWKVDLLKNIALFGNSFMAYEKFVSDFKNSRVVDSATHILAIQRFTDEIKINTVSDDYFGAFNDSSWHFFIPESERQLQLGNL